MNSRSRFTTTLALLAAGLMTAPGSAASAESGAERVFRLARDYTVRIRAQVATPFITDEQGSWEGAGFLVDAGRGWILTNAHVAGESPSEIQVAFAGEDFQPARKVYVDPFTDVAVLAIANAGKRRAAILNCDGEIRIGDPIGAFGHPWGMYFTGTRGIVSGKTDQLGPDFLQVDATVDPGNSGGPTISLIDGRVMGIATARSDGDKADRVNFATPLGDVGRILDLLRRGESPSPAHLPLAFLRDETGSHTLEVALSFDPERWPLEPGDRIVAVRGEIGGLETLGDLVTALRGRTGAVTLAVERGEGISEVTVMPVPTPLLTEARGVSLDGALIAPIALEDASNMRGAPGLFVHFVEPGSAAEVLGLERMDILHTIDGKAFDSLASLEAYLGGRPEGQPLRAVLSRWSESSTRWLDYIVRELPGEDIHPVGEDTKLVSTTGN